MAIRNIGNSKGILIPKSFLVQCNIETEVTMHIQGGNIIIAAAKPETKRVGWEMAFREMAENGDDNLAMPDVFNEEHDADWVW